MRGSVKTQYEYRINKKGSECFRTEHLDECKQKLAELNAKRNIYTMQVRKMRFGGYITSPAWEPWRDY